MEHGDGGVDVIGVTKLYDATTDADEIRAEVDSIRRLLDDRSVGYPIVVAAHDSPAHRSYLAASLPTFSLRASVERAA